MFHKIAEKDVVRNVIRELLKLKYFKININGGTCTVVCVSITV